MPPCGVLPGLMLPSGYATSNTLPLLYSLAPAAHALLGTPCTTLLFGSPQIHLVKSIDCMNEAVEPKVDLRDQYVRPLVRPGVAGVGSGVGVLSVEEAVGSAVGSRDRKSVV